MPPRHPVTPSPRQARRVTVFVMLLLPGVLARAQDQPQQSASPSSPAPLTGLDTLNDDALMNELAARGLNSLLDRAFELNHVLPQERRARLLLADLAKLGRSDIPDSQRRELIEQITTGLAEVLPNLDDPTALYHAGQQF